MAHRSRLGWSDAMDEMPTPRPTHTHRLPKSVRFALVGLVAAVFLLLVAVSLIGVYVCQQQQYIQGKGVQRDRENADVNRRIDDAVREGQCTLLDQLPADNPLLDRLRGTFGCGPGIPLSQLTPEEKAQIMRPAPAPTTPAESPSAATLPAPPIGAPPSPEAHPPPPGPVPPRTGPGPGGPPSPEPLRPVTNLVCDLLADVCPKESP